MKPGGGVGGQDFVIMSGGGATVINPNTKYPQQAWELLQFMNSAEMVRPGWPARRRSPRARTSTRRCWPATRILTFIAEKVMPITQFRPGLAEYPKVSQALQQATADVVGGKSVEDAAKAYQKAVEAIAGGKDKVGYGLARLPGVRAPADADVAGLGSGGRSASSHRRWC